MKGNGGREGEERRMNGGREKERREDRSREKEVRRREMKDSGQGREGEKMLEKQTLFHEHCFHFRARLFV